MSTETHHTYAWAPHANGVVVHDIPAERGSHSRMLVLVSREGYVDFLRDDEDNVTAEKIPGPHPYTVVEHDRTKRVKFGSGIHKAFLYLDIYGPDDFHARVLYDTVGIPIFAQQNGNYDD